MLKFLRKNQLLLLIIIFSVLIFSPALFNFFLGDDWFHLNIVQIASFPEFLNFFNPIPNPQSTAFYRPIPNQLFFYVFYQLFGLNSFFYHLFIFILFSFSLYLFYVFLKKIDLPDKVALISVFIVAFSHTNFSRLYFLSAGQETMLGVFILLGLLSNQKKETVKQNLITTLFYSLALLSKDSAIIFPILIIIFDWLKNRKIHFSKLLMLGLVTLGYLYARVVLFGFSLTVNGNESYTPNFSLKVLLNTLYVYSLWAVGGAELLQDYLRTPVILISRYFNDFGLIGRMMIASLGLMIVTIVALIIKNIKKISLLQLSTLAIFIIGLLPVIFFPSHKFAIQMSISMYGFALFLGLLLKDQSKKITILFLSLFLFLNGISILMTSKTHYTVQRANISKSVFNYMKINYPTLPSNSTIIFLNAKTVGSDIDTWGSSKQISHALMGKNFFEVMYPNLNIQTRYEDLEESIERNSKDNLYLNSGLFLK